MITEITVTKGKLTKHFVINIAFQGGIHTLLEGGDVTKVPGKLDVADGGFAALGGLTSNAYANDEVMMMMHCHDYTNFTDSLGRNKCELQGVREQEQISATDMAKVAWYVCFFVLPT